MTYLKHTPLKVPIVDAFLPTAPYLSACRCRICIKVLLNNRGYKNIQDNPEHQPQWTCLAIYRLLQVKSRYKIPDWQLRGHVGFAAGSLFIYYYDLDKTKSAYCNSRFSPKSLEEFYQSLDVILDTIIGARNEKGKQDEPAV